MSHGVLFLLTGRYETVLRLHGSSLWTQVDRVKLGGLTFSSTLLLNIFIYIIAQIELFFTLTLQFIDPEMIFV